MRVDEIIEQYRDDPEWLCVVLKRELDLDCPICIGQNKTEDEL